MSCLAFAEKCAEDYDKCSSFLKKSDDGGIAMQKF